MFVECKEGIENEIEIRNFLDELYKKNKSSYWILKRIGEIILTTVIIIFAAIPMLVIYLIIFFSDVHANPLFVQERVGRQGKTFKMYKFRTMVPDADKMFDKVLDQNEKDGPVFKIKNDPRITRVGRLLRATSLDELPQLYNVLKGDMVLIGPRPPLPREVEQYTEYQKLRLIVTPGITCIWQVQPDRDSISFDDWVKMDLDYILHRSIRLDIKIVFLTVLAIFRGYGS